jgi:predicted  nucleic acid-binding Zn-ribbon protein
MNKLILTCTITLGMVFLFSQVNAQVDKQAEKARKEAKEARKDMKEANENLEEANRDLIQAKIDSTTEYIAFKNEVEINIANNKKSIAELRAKKWSSSTKAEEKYTKQINKLEKRNENLELSINKANYTNSTKWDSFKREFKRDMQELGQALKDLAVNNTN